MSNVRWLTPPREGDAVGLIEALGHNDEVLGSWREGDGPELVVPNGVTIERFRVTTNSGAVAHLPAGFAFGPFLAVSFGSEEA